jgi:hypothetical protein
MNDSAKPSSTPERRPVYKRTGFWAAVAAIAVVGAIANGVHESPSADTTNDAKPETATSAAPSPSPTESSLDDVLDGTDETSASAEGATETVPNVVGLNHADAITALHTAGFMVNEEDASGEGRMIILNSNWKVCRQDPDAGATDVLRVAIYSVKLDESC